MSKTSEILSEEHKNILKVVEALNKETEKLKLEEEINKAFFAEVIEFIKNYADKFHHAKEEEILFKEFNKACEEGRLHCNPIEQMMHEHEIGRKFVKEMIEGLEKEDKSKLKNGANGYTNLLKEHIFKEDNILYPMADDALSPKVHKELEEKAKAAEAKLKAVKERGLAFAKEAGNR